MADFRLKVTLDKVKCFKTEDDFGADEFYVIAALQKQGGKPIPKFDGVWDINDGGELDWAPDGNVLFNVEVNEFEEYALEIRCFDQDHSDPITQEILEEIAERVDDFWEDLSESKRVNTKSQTSDDWFLKLIDGLFYLIGLLVALDKDDFLGSSNKVAISIPNDIPIFDDSFGSPRKGKFWCYGHGCKYRVHYSIHLTDI